MRALPSTPIGDLVTRGSAWTPDRDDPDGDFTYIDLSAVDQDEKVIAAPRQIVCADAPSRARQLVRTDDVLVSTVRPNLNAVARVPAGLDGATASTAFCVLRPIPDRIDSSYLLQWVRSSRFVAAMVRRATGASYPAVSDRIVLESRIPLPPLPEQRRIAEILDKADALRAKRRAALTRLDTLAQSIFLDMFGDPITNSKSWKRVALPDAVVGRYGIKAGPFGSSLKKTDYAASGYRVYGQEQVLAGRFDIGNYYIGEHKYQQLRSCALGEGDLLVSLVGSFGKVLIVPRGIEPGIINPRLLKITPNQAMVTPAFLAALLQHPTVQAEFQRVAHGGTMGILNAGLLKQLKIILPPIEFQGEFVRRVMQAEALKSAHRAALSEADALFSSLQHRAFRGEL